MCYVSHWRVAVKEYFRLPCVYALSPLYSLFLLAFPLWKLFSSLSPHILLCLYWREEAGRLTAAHFEAGYIRPHFGSTSPSGHTHTHTHTRTSDLRILILCTCMQNRHTSYRGYACGVEMHIYSYTRKKDKGQGQCLWYFVVMYLSNCICAALSTWI